MAKKTSIVVTSSNIRRRNRKALNVSIKYADGSGLTFALSVIDAQNLIDKLNDAMDDPTEQDDEAAFNRAFPGNKVQR